MIKLFRKIRQNLLLESKTRKPGSQTGRYFKYAIGEIILVVIGILIALQINNWNENNKKFNSWQKYNESLIKDLEQDKTTLGEVTKFINKQSKVVDSISARLSAEDATKDTLVSIVRNDLFMDTKAYRPPNNKTFLAMQANGTVELFDKETYSILLELQNQQAIAGSIIRANNAVYITHMENLISKYSLTRFDLLSGPLIEDYWSNVDKYDLLETAQGYLTAVKLMNSNTGVRYKELLDFTEKVLERLKRINSK